MLCSRCQQREARDFPAKKRAALEAEFGAPLQMFRNDLCEKCWEEWFREWIKSPEARAEMEQMKRAMLAKWRRDVEKWEQKARSAALKILNLADDLVGKL